MSMSLWMFRERGKVSLGLSLLTNTFEETPCFLVRYGLRNGEEPTAGGRMFATGHTDTPHTRAWHGVQV